MRSLIFAILFICVLFQISTAQNLSVQGTVWIDKNGNNTFDNEDGVEDIKVYLIDTVSNQVIDSTLTQNFEYKFPSTDSLPLPPGTYFLEVPTEEFNLGGSLQHFISCVGFNDANDGVDLDDNGMDTYPLQTTHFTLDTGAIEYVDLCFYADCNEEVVSAKETCDLITKDDIFCSISLLDNVCGLMPAVNSQGNQPLPLCQDGGAPHNISWFAFIADAGDYEVTITPSACFGSTTGEDGVQMGLYKDCSFTESVFCNTECNLNPVTFSSDLLIQGQIYYFFIDGCNGSVCSYEIEVIGNPSPPILIVDEVCIVDEGTNVCEDLEYCEEEEISFVAETNKYIVSFTWEITTLVGGPFMDSSVQVTGSNTIDLKFDNKGVYTVCLIENKLLCSTISYINPACRRITINGSTNEAFDSIAICQDALAVFDINVIGDQDPNNDGVFGWIDESYDFEFGNNVSTVMDSNMCAYKQEIFLSEVEQPQISLSPNSVSLCVGDTLKFDLSTNENFDSITWLINSIQQTDEIGSLVLDAGVYNFMATIYNACGTNSDEVLIQVFGTPDEVFNSIVICQDSLAVLDINAIGDEDPNSDGITGWFNTDFEFGLGTNESIVMDSNMCAYKQEIFLSGIEQPQISISPALDSLCLGDTISFDLATNVNYDSILWGVNGTQQTEGIGEIAMDIGVFDIQVTIYNLCGINQDQATLNVLDTISAPNVTCDTSNAGMILLSWPDVNVAEGYWLSINGGSSFLITDSFYVIDDLASAEILNIEFNVVDSLKCVGPNSNFVCVAPTIVSVKESSTNNIQIIPNPASDYIVLKEGPDLSNMNFTIYTIEGKLLSSGRLNASSRIDVKSFPAGLYIISIGNKNSKNRRIGRFVKE